MNLLIRFEVFSDGLIGLGDLICQVRVDYLVGDNLVEVLQGWVECLFWIQVFLNLTLFFIYWAQV